MYGYTFEHEATYDRMCLVNDAVYIAKYKDGKHAGEWTATGKQFQVPYVFKKLFSKEEVVFDDMCETMSVSTALYLDMNEGLCDVSDLEAEASRLAKKYHGFGEYEAYAYTGDELEKYDAAQARYKELRDIIDSTMVHNLHFIGKVGNFCPIKPGCGGGELLREGKDKEGNVKYSAATGSKGYRWLESEMVRTLNKEDDIDTSYYDAQIDTAVEAISQYGDFEWFVSEDPYVSPWYNADDPNELPWYSDEELKILHKINKKGA